MVKFVVIADGLKPFDYVAKGKDIAEEIAKEIDRRSSFWYEALVFGTRENGTTFESTIRNDPE